MVDLLDKKEDGKQPLYGNCAYRSKTLDEIYRQKGIINKIIEQGYRFKKITSAQEKTKLPQIKDKSEGRTRF